MSTNSKVYCNCVKYVIFDLDGLLLNSQEIYFKAYSEIVKPYCAVITEKLKVKLMGRTAKDSIKIIIEDLKIPTTLEKFTKLVNEQMPKWLENVALMPGAERLVKHLKASNVPIAVATSSTKESFDHKIRKHKELFHLFHHIVTGGSDPEVKHGKPAPDIFLVCASRFDKPADPRDCLVFEDAPSGVKAAVSAGMQVVMVPDKIVPQEEKNLQLMR